MPHMTHPQKSPVRQIIESHLPALRRFAWAYTGSRTAGDDAVSIFLKACISQSDIFKSPLAHKVRLFQLLHRQIKLRTHVHETIEQLGRQVRSVFLLSALEHFSTSDIAAIIGEPETRAVFLLRHAETQSQRNEAMEVLIIEDEALIAMELKAIVEKMGHRVVGRAATQRQAMMLAKQLKPDLVLADVQLAGGDSGIQAVSDLRKLSDIEPVFVTAFPDRVSKSMDSSPLFIISKPFAPDLIETTLSQAAMQRHFNEAARHAR